MSFELARTGSNYLQDTDPEFLPLCAVLEDFSGELHATDYSETSESLTPRVMRRAVRRQIWQLFESPMLEFIVTINTMAMNMTEEDIPPAMEEYIETQANSLSDLVEGLVRQHTPFERQGPTESCTNGCIQAI